MEAFLTAFWPNLAATLVGVALGLPIAMWVNRLALRGAERTARKSQAQRVDHALKVLISAMQANAVLLREYAELLESGMISWRLRLDVSAWEAIKGDFVAELTDPALRQQVAFHFSQLVVLSAINQEFLGFNFGTNASMSGARDTRTQLCQTLKSMCIDLSAQGESLVTISKETQHALEKYI